MKSLSGLLLALAIVVTAVPYARSVGTPSSPPGIPAKSWIALGDDAGFVITSGASVPSATRSSPGTVNGYFMVHQGKLWLRVDSQPEYQIYPAAPAH